MARKKGTSVVRRGSSPQVAKLKARLASKNQRSRQQSREMLADLSAVGGGALLGWLDTQKWTEKVNLPGIDDSAVYGLGFFILGSNLSGKFGGIAKGLGVGMLSCAARDFVNGDTQV